MAAEPLPRPSRALRDVLERVDLLSEVDLLHLYERLVAELDGQPVGEPRRDRRLQERAEALRALHSARDELGLSDGERMTVRAFNEICQRRIADWNANRVIRAWGTWRNAADVLAGARPPRRAEREAVTLVRGFRRSACRPPLDGLLEWLAGNPTERSMHAYDVWARARNAELGPDEQPYLGGSGVAAAMGMNFAPARRQAEAILADEEPPPPEGYEAAGHTLVTLAAFAQVFGLSKTGLLARAKRAPLPPPVLRHDDRVFWLADDCELWRKDKTIERQENELSQEVLDRERLAERLGITINAVRNRHLHHPHLLPDPAGQLGGRPWWAPAVVERWLAEHQGVQPLHYRYRGPSIIEVGSQRLLTLAAVCELLGISEQRFDRMRRLRPLVPAVVFGSSKLWLVEDAQAYRDGQAIKRKAGELNSLLLGIQGIAERLNVTPDAVRRGVARGSDLYPQPGVGRHAR